MRKSPNVLAVMFFAALVSLNVSAQLTPGELAGDIPFPNLVWDAELKEVKAKSSDPLAEFYFNFTNKAPIEVTINSLKTSCGCTSAKLPAEPWRLAPGSNGQIHVTMKLMGKSGVVTKDVTLDTSVGAKVLQVRTILPSLIPGEPTALTQEERARNMQLATTNRQAVFHGDCADCHAKPAKGKSGPALYAAVCGICHDSPNRASTVPDLRVAKSPRNLEFWRQWIRNGKAGTMMPAFETAQGGPLDELQIAALAVYLNGAFPGVANKADAASGSTQVKQ